MDNGWISIHRKLTKWGWYHKSEMVHLFLHFLLMANHEDGEWQGNVIKRGQLVTGLKSLHKNTSISPQTLRTCITRLKSTNEITVKSTNKFSIITILKYDDYQTELRKSTSKITSKLTNNQQTTNKQLTTNNKDNKNNNDNNKNIKSSKMTEVDFDAFWIAYPKKADKQKARNKFLKLSKDLLPTILKALENQNKQWAMIGKTKEFIPNPPNPTTWLNNARWEDEIREKTLEELAKDMIDACVSEYGYERGHNTAWYRFVAKYFPIQNDQAKLKYIHLFDI